MTMSGMRAFALAACGLCAVAAVSPAFAASYYDHSVIASGLNNPRGLTFGPDGALYIAEGGTFNPGGPTTTVEGGPAAYGTSGSITRLEGGTQTRVVNGLPSLTGTTSGSASGPQDVAFYNGTGYVVIGLGANPAVRTDPGQLGSAPGAANLASLYSFTPSGTFSKVADLGNYETSVNPDGGAFDSNPYHLTAGPNGLLVTDAGGNSLLNVTSTGLITTLDTFARLGGTVDSVPTGVSIGPDGAFYVGELTGFPFTPGSASIYRIDQLTGEQTVFATGLTNITDIAWGDDGLLYALQFADTGILGGGTGSIRRINGDGTNTLIYGGIEAPTGFEIGDDGAFYVTNRSPAPGVGEVWRIAVVPEPATWLMMISGFGLAGAMMRRNRTTTVRFA